MEKWNRYFQEFYIPFSPLATASAPGRWMVVRYHMLIGPFEFKLDV
jgi:hypothetical protein